MFKGKRFLITQSSLRLIAGSEINTLELAEHLLSEGATVTVYTYFLSEPISNYFEDRGLRVVTDDVVLNVDDFDYVWVHHQVIPASFIDRVSLGSEAGRLPLFIFLHMSGLKTHFLEQAHIWSLEERIASKVLFVSDEAKDNVAENSLQIKGLNTGFYRNPTPVSYTRTLPDSKAGVARVLVVSNHPVKEVIDAVSILRGEGIEVVVAGEGQDEYKLIDADYLCGFDVVVSIGKTVQYCLVSGVPVYIYDVWGGPGYLNSKNEADAVWYNLSGRGFEKKTAAAIAKDIVSNYKRSASYQLKHHSRFIQSYSMTHVLPDIINDLKAREFEPFDRYYTQYLHGVLVMLKYKFYHENLLTLTQAEVEKLKGSLRLAADALQLKADELKLSYDALDAIKQSQSYRLGGLIAKPLREFKSLIRRQ